MRAPTADEMLFAWERGQYRHPIDRALLLYSIAASGGDPDILGDRPLGQRNSELLRLRESMFGDLLKACVVCPGCGERLEFSLSAVALRAQSGGGKSHVEVDGHRFRLPTTRDLARISRESDEDTAVQKLLLSLMDGNEAADEYPADLVSRVASALEEADPCSDFALELNCPSCGHAWTATFDIAGYLWEEIDAQSRRLLDEVHLLARAYGWSEREILSLSEARRATYLERAMT